MVPMKRFKTGIREVIDYATANGFHETRLNASRPKSRSWPYEDKKGVENDHLIILSRGRLRPRSEKKTNVDSVAMAFNYVDVTPTVKFTYRPAGHNDNDSIEESAAYNLDDFRELLNSFVRELPNIRGFGSVSIQDAFIAAWIKHFKVGTQDTTDAEVELESKLATLYAEYEMDMVDKKNEHKKAVASVGRARNTIDKKLKESELTARRDELNKELERVNLEINKFRTELKEKHSIDSKKQRERRADRDLYDHVTKYSRKKEELLKQYPKAIARKFSRRFILDGE